MTPQLLVLAVMVAAPALMVAVVATLGALRRRGRLPGAAQIHLRPLDDEGTYAVRTRRSRGRARLVVHEEKGRVYEVTLKVRGSAETTRYCPPSVVMVRRAIEAVEAAA